MSTITFSVTHTHLGFARVLVADGNCEHVEYVPYSSKNGVPGRRHDVEWYDDQLALRVSVRAFDSCEAVFVLSFDCERVFRQAA